MKLLDIDTFLNSFDFKNVKVVVVVAPKSSGKSYVGSYLARTYKKQCHVVTFDLLTYGNILPSENMTYPNEKVPDGKKLLVYDCEHTDLPKFLPDCGVFVFMVRHVVQIPNAWRDAIDIMVVPHKSDLDRIISNL